MHKKYARDGLVCVSVSVDDPDNKDAALKFLRAKNATFANYLLDEDAGVWQSEWKFKGPPAVQVYGRDGKLVRQFDNDDPDSQYTYEDVEHLVQKLLQEKR
jgi:hypothetical protein